MKQFVRDSTVHIRVTFRDKNGDIVEPPSATFTLAYLPVGGGDPTYVTVTPEIDVDSFENATWFYNWDSSVSAPCTVSGHAESVGLTERSTVDFDFRLIANKANRLLAGNE